MTQSSKLPGFYTLTVNSRRQIVKNFSSLTVDDMKSLDSTSMTIENADAVLENVIGTFGLPLAVGVNFVINSKDMIVPMVIEEPSVIAAASNSAKLVRKAGGFQAESDESIMIGQIQIVNLPDISSAKKRLESSIPEIMEMARAIHPNLESHGGGIRGAYVQTIRYDEPGEEIEDMIIFHFYLDCADSMGANMVNEVAEQLSSHIEDISGGNVILRILSNLATSRLARARCTIPFSCLETSDMTGEEVARRIVSAYRFAWSDPWRAATHNKGIMNGIDSVALATGNDWRAIESGAHAWATRDGQYRPLSKWKIIDNSLHGFLELPMQVGTASASVKRNPCCIVNMKILGNPTSRTLAAVITAVGLAQNLGALRALVIDGIQNGHMKMHSRYLQACKDKTVVVK